MKNRKLLLWKRDRERESVERVSGEVVLTWMKRGTLWDQKSIRTKLWNSRRPSYLFLSLLVYRVVTKSMHTHIFSRTIQDTQNVDRVFISIGVLIFSKKKKKTGRVWWLRLPEAITTPFVITRSINDLSIMFVVSVRYAFSVFNYFETSPFSLGLIYQWRIITVMCVSNVLYILSLFLRIM